jgi:hypothetical protein
MMTSHTGGLPMKMVDYKINKLDKSTTNSSSK